MHSYKVEMEESFGQGSNSAFFQWILLKHSAYLSHGMVNCLYVSKQIRVPLSPLVLVEGLLWLLGAFPCSKCNMKYVSHLGFLIFSITFFKTNRVLPS